MSNVRSSTRSIPKPASSPTSTGTSSVSTAPVPKDKQAAYTGTWWITLYWMGLKLPNGDYPFCDLMCSPKEYETEYEADREWRINRLLLEEVMRVGNQAQKIVWLEEEAADAL